MKDEEEEEENRENKTLSIAPLNSWIILFSRSLKELY